ncbi:MAG: BatA domain-containing protein [Verrucomicrobiota bacterium]
MSFLQPFMLWGLLAISVPIIIHLLNRRRHRTVKWAAMDFLLKATRESRGKKKLKHVLILTCRALAVAALIFAISRPLLGGFLGFGATVDTVILILDRSASMERVEADGQPSKRQLVLRQVADAMAELETASLYLLDSATGQISEIPSPETLPELSTTSGTDTAADLPSLFASALDFLRKAEPGHTEIWLATDLQLADWRPEDARWPAFSRSLRDLPTPTSLRVLALPETPRENNSLRLLSTRRTPSELFVELELTREDSLNPAILPVTLNLDGATTAESVQIDAQTLRFSRTIPISDAESSGWGSLTLPPDSNLRDNAVYFTYGPPRTQQTTLIYEAGLSSETLRALQRASAPPGLANFKSTSLPWSRDGITGLDLTETSLLLWAAPLPTDTDAVLIRTFLESGGQVLFLPPLSDSDTSFETLAWTKLETAPTGKYFISTQWRKDEGPWRDGIDGTTLPVDQLQAVQRRTLAESSDLVPLASWDDGSPLLARRILGAGALHILNTLPDLAWSDLEQTALHLVLIQRLLADGSKRLHANRQLAGQPSPAAAIRLDNDSPENEFPLHAGIYRLTDSSQQALALNVPPDELTLAQLDPKEITKTLLPDAPVTFFEQQASNDNSLLQEIWRPFLIAMLFFLLAEAILTLNKKRSDYTSPNKSPTADAA